MTIKYRKLKLFGVCAVVYIEDAHCDLKSRLLRNVLVWMVNYILIIIV
jgi:hypothetical protein